MKIAVEEDDVPAVNCEPVIVELSRPLRCLQPFHVVRIDRMLSEMGEYGEVRLIKVKGRLRFIQRTESEDA